jgi:tryptophanyl-tRNA synthetase
MSKSNPSPGSRVELHDSPDEIRRKIRRAVTDSDAEVRYDEAAKPAVSNLMNIYALFARMTTGEVERRFEGKGYGEFKSELGEVVVEGLAPIQQRLAELESNPDEIARLIGDGRDRAHGLAGPKMDVVREVTGLGLGRPV